MNGFSPLAWAVVGFLPRAHSFCIGSKPFLSPNRGGWTQPVVHEISLGKQKHCTALALLEQPSSPRVLLSNSSCPTGLRTSPCRYIASNNWCLGSIWQQHSQAASASPWGISQGVQTAWPQPPPPIQGKRCSWMGFIQILHWMRLQYHRKYTITSCCHSVSLSLYLGSWEAKWGSQTHSQHSISSSWQAWISAWAVLWVLLVLCKYFYRSEQFYLCLKRCFETNFHILHLKWKRLQGNIKIKDGEKEM